MGAIAGLGAALSLALGGLLLHKWPRPVPLLAFTAWQLCVGGCELAFCAFVIDDVPSTLSASQVAGLAYLAIASTTVAYSLWFYCIETAGASVAAPLLQSGHCVHA